WKPQRCPHVKPVRAPRVCWNRQGTSVESGNTSVEIGNDERTSGIISDYDEGLCIARLRRLWASRWHDLRDCSRPSERTASERTRRLQETRPNVFEPAINIFECFLFPLSRRECLLKLLDNSGETLFFYEKICEWGEAYLVKPNIVDRTYAIVQIVEIGQ